VGWSFDLISPLLVGKRVGEVRVSRVICLFQAHDFVIIVNGPPPFIFNRVTGYFKIRWETNEGRSFASEARDAKEDGV
jgi:hypothetical protein